MWTCITNYVKSVETWIEAPSSIAIAVLEHVNGFYHFEDCGIKEHDEFPKDYDSEGYSIKKITACEIGKIN
jgi:hypothetical protein